MNTLLGLGNIKKAALTCVVFAAGLSSSAFADQLFSGDYALQNWSMGYYAPLGLNSQTITPSSGDSNMAVFSWNAGYYGGPGAGYNAFDFYTTATGNDTLSFHWEDNAFAGYFMSYQNAYAYYYDASGVNLIPLGWNTSGDATMTVANGYIFGFFIQSGNADLDSRVIGSLTITNHNVPDSGASVALLGGALLGFLALRRKFARA